MSENNLSEEIIFKPRYPAQIMLSIYLYPLGILIFFFCIYLAITTGRLLPYGLFALIFGFTAASMPMIVFRELRIKDVILVRRYFLPKRIIRFESVTGLTSRGLLAKGGGIPLVNVQNRKEFEKIIQRLEGRHLITLEK